MYQYPPEEEAGQHIPEGVVEKDIILNEGSEYELPGKITMPENAAEGIAPAGDQALVSAEAQGNGAVSGTLNDAQAFGALIPEDGEGIVNTATGETTQSAMAQTADGALISGQKSQNTETVSAEGNVSQNALVSSDGQNKVISQQAPPNEVADGRAVNPQQADTMTKAAPAEKTFSQSFLIICGL